ncbi:AI-2E family transporter [Planctomycetota bacterium]
MARKKKRSGDSTPSSPPTTPRPQRPSPLIAKGTSVTKIASLLVLVVIIILIMILFYRVMASFMLPLFLAALFSVLFRPIHAWMLDRFRGRETVAAGLTTASILGIVLLPLIWIGSMAIGEAWDLRRGFDPQVLVRSLDKVGRGWPLNFQGRPFKEHLEDLDKLFAELPTQLPDHESRGGLVEPLREAEGFAKQLRESVVQAAKGSTSDHPVDDASAVAAQIMLNKEWILTVLPEEQDETEGDGELEANAEKPVAYLDPQFVVLNDLLHDLDLAQQFFKGAGEKWEATLQSKEKEKEDEELDDNRKEVNANDKEKAERNLSEIRTDFPRLNEQWRAVRAQIHGGHFRMQVHDVLFPTQSFVERVDTSVRDYGGKLLSFETTTKATATIGQFLAHLAIMILGIFYFLKDGPGMIRAVMRLSPLDDRYEKELLSEFDSVSRAVVMATLLSALAQGLLAGIGYYFVGFDTVLMLTMLTMVIAMIPVVGAAAVWVPACLWLLIVDNRTGAAIGLAIYGATVVSMIDNLIKPFVLHGQSNLHPLLALLSVLGGVSALGPIGIIVGPMVVSFLQALLNMLHLELQEFDRHVEPKSPAPEN